MVKKTAKHLKKVAQLTYHKHVDPNLSPKPNTADSADSSTKLKSYLLPALIFVLVLTIGAAAIYRWQDLLSSSQSNNTPSATATPPSTRFFNGHITLIKPGYLIIAGGENKSLRVDLTLPTKVNIILISTPESPKPTASASTKEASGSAIKPTYTSKSVTALIGDLKQGDAVTFISQTFNGVTSQEITVIR